MAPPPATRSAFFYGTLMAPSVLNRVTNRSPATTPSKPALDIRPAILPGFRRHRVIDVDYPAIVPTPHDPKSEVRGTYVTGLTADDVARLDAFEGGEYERRPVRVRVLPAAAPLGGPAKKKVPAAEEFELVEVVDASRVVDAQEVVGPAERIRPVELIEVTDQVEAAQRARAKAAKEVEADAETYVWIADPDDLEDQEWDFDQFVKKKLWMWAGGQGDSGFADAAAVQGVEDGVDTTRGRSVNGGEFEKKVMGL